MITFRHKSNTKQIKIKSNRQLNQRMTPWLQGIFNIKNPIVGFKFANNKYYDTQSFYSHIQKFYGQVIDIIEAKDQLEISFVSDNLNSSSNARNVAHPQFVQDFQDEQDETFKTISDIRSMQRRLQDNKQLTILFNISQIHRNQIVESINLIKTHQSQNKVNFYLIIIQAKKTQIPTYCIYVGKKIVATLNLTREYKETILMVIQRHSKRNKIISEKQQQKQQQVFRVSYDQQNQAPSFTTYQLQQRLNQQACQDYLLRMCQQKALKKYQYLKLNEKCEQNFAQFYRIFCEGAIDNDYQNFKHEIRHKVDNNLQILLSNVDQMDLSRPISREEQRKQNLKKSVSNIQIVKVQIYFEILDQLKSLLSPYTFSLIKNQLLDQNQTVFSGFSDFLSRKISKEDLAHFLQRAVEKNQKRPISRCLPRSANRNRQQAYHSQDQFLISAPNYGRPYKKQDQPRLRKQSSENQIQQKQASQKQQPQLIKLVGMTTGSGSGAKQNKNQNKQTPPMFGSLKQQKNFSPMKYMSDIESNYKQAWTRLENKSQLFEPQQYGLLYYYLETKDDSISNHIQELQWNQHSTVDKLKKFLQQRMIQIMQKNFAPHQLDLIAANRQAPEINCIYENFKFQSDLNQFLKALHAEVNLIVSHSASPSPSLSLQQPVNRNQFLNKKSSDSNLLAPRKKSTRKYSDEHQQVHSPRQSSCINLVNKVSHAKTNEASAVYTQFLNSFWNQQFEQMIEHCSFTEQHKQQYLRDAFKLGNPSVYSWINSYVQGKLGIIDTKQLKNSLKIKQQQNKYAMRVVPIFTQILKSFQQQGHISQKMRKWCVVQLMQLNMSIIGAFEHYIKIKNSQQFVQNITLAYELQNSEMQYFRSYINRIQNLLIQISCHDKISFQLFKLYPKQIKAICQVYYITGDINQLLDNLDVLHSIQQKRRIIKVGTLNFAGINVNPFQYFDGTQDIEIISNNMKQILKTQQKQINIRLGIIDKFYSNNLMSVRYGTKMCQNQFLLTRRQYTNKWKQFYRQNRPQIISGDDEDVIQAMIHFDYYCYISVVKYVYAVQWNVTDYTDKLYKHIQKNYQIQDIDKLPSNKLKQYLEIKYNRPASKTQHKYQLTMDYFLKLNLDVFFLQEAGNASWEEELIHEFGWVKNAKSVILFRKDKFGHPKLSLYQKYKDKLNFNDDSAFYFGDRGYLLLSIHLSSRPERHFEQAEQLFKVLEEIYNEHPMIKIIIGIDANHFIGGCKLNFLNFIPKTKQEFTINKKRTYVQVQFIKSGQLCRSCKDYILTNLQIKNYSIQKVNETPIEEINLIPSNEHPYDHFIVTATI